MTISNAAKAEDNDDLRLIGIVITTELIADQNS